MKKYDAEIIALGERIMKHCPDQDIRLEATARLAKPAFIRDRIKADYGNPEAPGEAALRQAQELGISHLMEREISADAGELSGGEKQKIALARALMREDRVLLDEPDNHLDDKSLEWLKNFIKDTERISVAKLVRQFVVLLRVDQSLFQKNTGVLQIAVPIIEFGFRKNRTI